MCKRKRLMLRVQWQLDDKSKYFLDSVIPSETRVVRHRWNRYDKRTSTLITTYHRNCSVLKIKKERPIL